MKSTRDGLEDALHMHAARTIENQYRRLVTNANNTNTAANNTAENMANASNPTTTNETPLQPIPSTSSAPNQQSSNYDTLYEDAYNTLHNEVAGAHVTRDAGNVETLLQKVNNTIILIIF